MAGFALNLSGLDSLTKRLNSIKNDVSNEVANELSASSMNIEKMAKREAPVNLGGLRNSIHALSSSKLTHSVVVGASYGAYIEFGTGGKVSIPAGYESYAAQFKGGKNGTFADMVKDLAQWVKRKGLAGSYSVKTQRRVGSRSTQSDQDMKLAYAIAISILRNGIRPQPYLIPAYEIEKPKLFKRLKTLLNAKS